MKVPRLKQFRTKQVMTQLELAQKAGVPPSTISRIEDGSGAHPNTIRTLAKALGVEPSELVEEQS